MTRPDKKRGFRPMIVNDDTYHWRIKRFEGHALLEIQHAAMNGQRLLVDLHAKPIISMAGSVISLDESYEQVIVRPKFVREAVIYALENGWTPQIAAPMLRIDAHEANLPFAELTKSPFDTVLDDILSRMPLIDKTNLMGFDIDLVHALSNGQILLNVKTQKTDDPRCILIATGELSPNCREPLQAGEFMKKQWLDKICYKGFEAHQIFYKPETIDFRFVTINKTANYCVTGKVVIKRY